MLTVSAYLEETDMDELDTFAPKFSPTAKRPLLGLTVLVVEDSRYASEAMRLMCLSSGARIRRADCLRSARRHLQVYRPSVVVIDIGLPDGSGLDLIAELDRATPRVGAILALSGDDHMRSAALVAGADSFMAKPATALGAFQQAVLAALPKDQQSGAPFAASTETVTPDPLAFRDDMTHIASLLDAPQSGPVLDYVAQFLGSVARSARDDSLETAAADLAMARASGGVSPAKVARLAGLVHERLHQRIAI